MKTARRILVPVLLGILMGTPAFGDPSAFPSNGLDAQSLGRGGTVIACRPGIWSTFGNPATLTPEGYYILGFEHVDVRGMAKNSWGISVVDTSSSIRGSASYYTEPVSGEFQNEMWGVSFSQTLMGSLFIGESFHIGEYEPELEPGHLESINTVDAGLLYKLGPKVSFGYVAHNLIPKDRDLLKQYGGFGISMQLPKTIYLAVDYEEAPGDSNEMNLRTGIEFNPLKKITGRLGYQDLAGGESYYTMGLTYTDRNGTVDAAVGYNDQTEKTDRIILGLSIRM